jgi:hypothetical protein
VDDSLAAAELSAIPSDVMKRVRDLYDARIKPLVHQRW